MHSAAALAPGGYAWSTLCVCVGPCVCGGACADMQADCGGACGGSMAASSARGGCMTGVSARGGCMAALTGVSCTVTAHCIEALHMLCFQGRTLRPHNQPLPLMHHHHHHHARQEPALAAIVS